MTSSATHPKVVQKRKVAGGISIKINRKEYTTKYSEGYGHQLRLGIQHFQILDAKTRKVCRWSKH